MLMYGVLITLVGMGAVYAFLLLLMWTIQLMSVLVQKTTQNDEIDKVAALLAIALKNGRR